MAVHSAAGKTFYISPFGDDNTGNGSKENPWKSLLKATSVINTPGDVIHINKGVFIEVQSCVLAAGVSIEGEGERSIIKSAVPGIWTALILARSEEGTMGNQSISGVVLDGQQMTGFLAIWVTGRSYVSINNCHIKDFKDRGVIFDGRNDNQAGPPKIYAVGNSFHHNILENCAAYNTENGIYGRGCLNIGGQDSMEIHDNLITQLARPDGFNGWPIKYSNDGFIRACRIYRNDLRKSPFTGNYAGENGWDFAIELWNLEGGIEISDNKIQGSVDLVTCSKGKYSYGVWIRNNFIQQEKLNEHFESGLIIEQSANSLIIENNKFNRLSGGILFNAQKGTVINNVIIRKNDFKDIGRNTGNGNNGNFINFNMGYLFGKSEGYMLKEVHIVDNTFSMSKGNAPLFGLIFSGYANAKKINILRNSFENVNLAWLSANPANAIDTLSVIRNKIINSGRNGKALYIDGRPKFMISSFNEITSEEVDGIEFKTRIREQILRPLYYELKATGKYIIVISVILLISFIFMLRKSVMALPFFLLTMGLLSYGNYVGNVSQNIIMTAVTAPCIFISWVKWNKNRGKRAGYIGNIEMSGIKGFREIVLFCMIATLTYCLSLVLLPHGSPVELALISVAISCFCISILSFSKEKHVKLYWIMISAGAFSIFSLYRNSLISSFFFASLMGMSILYGILTSRKRIRNSANVSDLR